MRVKLDRTKCIGCGACFGSCPDVFEMKEDGKSSLKSVKTADVQEQETEIGCSKDAAEICPAKCINVS